MSANLFMSFRITTDSRCATQLLQVKARTNAKLLACTDDSANKLTTIQKPEPLPMLQLALQLYIDS